MKWFLILTAAVAALLVLAVLVGMALPEAHVARAGARVEGEPEAVWEVLVAADAYPEWRPGVKAVEVLERKGSAATRWTERTRAGPVTMEAVERDRPRRLVLRIAETELPFSGRWTYELRPEDGGTRVRIVEEGVIEKPVLRFAARFVLGYEARIRDVLEGLVARMAKGRDDDAPGRSTTAGG